MSVLNVVNICLIHFLIETVRDPLGIPTSKLPCFYTLRFSFFYFYLLIYFLPACFDIQRKKFHHNTCIRTEMKMNDPKNQKSALEHRTLLKARKKKGYCRSQISGIKLTDNVSKFHLREINFVR